MLELVELIAPAFLLLCIVRFVLIAKSPGGATLPHPSKVPGLPIAGPASIAAARAAASRTG